MRVDPSLNPRPPVEPPPPETLPLTSADEASTRQAIDGLGGRTAVPSDTARPFLPPSRVLGLPPVGRFDAVLARPGVPESMRAASVLAAATFGFRLHGGLPPGGALPIAATALKFSALACPGLLADSLAVDGFRARAQARLDAGDHAAPLAAFLQHVLVALQETDPEAAADFTGLMERRLAWFASDLEALCAPDAGRAVAALLSLANHPEIGAALGMAVEPVATSVEELDRSECGRFWKFRFEQHLAGQAVAVEPVSIPEMRGVALPGDSAVLRALTTDPEAAELAGLRESHPPLEPRAPAMARAPADDARLVAQALRRLGDLPDVNRLPDPAVRPERTLIRAD